MCLLVFAWHAHPELPLIFAGNRDEAHARRSAAAGFWQDAPQVLAGRDLEAGGTWLGVTTRGRFAVVTNYRDGPQPMRGPRSRGELVADFLRSAHSPEAYIREVGTRAARYAGFSLLAGDRDALWYVSNRGAAAQAIPPGVHGLSNHLLDTPWPKLLRSTERLELLLDANQLTEEALFRLLADRRPAHDAELPDTGIGTERERALSAPFVVNPEYGTRCSTLIRLGADSLRFSERRFSPAGERTETRRFMLEEAL
ncbi:MAG TPA: NRDE family protein [Gammaproteobacteria bacterium]|nr:NRDE family protein [Gammaproteobacteria bacterium]